MHTDWFEVVDPRFEALILHNVHVDQLFDGGRWLEGPVYVPAARHLLFSDIPNNRVMRYNECDGSVSVFEAPSEFANGHTLDRQGRVIACEHKTRRVTRREHDGSLTVLADSFEGKRLNSPNDVVCASDGSVWFTDPTYGISTEYEGSLATSEIGSRNVYRISPAGSISAVITDLTQPNGLAFSPDEKTLYVIDSGSRPRRILAYEISADGNPVNARVLQESDSGGYDGMRLDRDGNIWTSAPGGVHCLSAEGELLGRIRLPEVVANLAFGGPARNRLYICATRKLFAVYVNTAGA